MSKYTTLSEEAISYICGLLRDMASVSDAVDDIHLRTDGTFSSVKIDNLIKQVLADGKDYSEQLCSALVKLTCSKTTVQPTLNNSEINVIYLYSADGNAPFEQYLKISDTELVDMGSTTIDLSDYYDKTTADNRFALKSDVTDIINLIGPATLETTNKTLKGAINEVNSIVTDNKGKISNKADKLTNNLKTNQILVDDGNGNLSGSGISISDLDKSSNTSVSETDIPILPVDRCAESIYVLQNASLISNGDIYDEDYPAGYVFSGAHDAYLNKKFNKIKMIVAYPGLVRIGIVNTHIVDANPRYSKCLVKWLVCEFAAYTGYKEWEIEDTIITDPDQYLFVESRTGSSGAYYNPTTSNITIGNITYPANSETRGLLPADAYDSTVTNKVFKSNSVTTTSARFTYNDYAANKSSAYKRAWTDINYNQSAITLNENQRYGDLNLGIYEKGTNSDTYYNRVIENCLTPSYTANAYVPPLQDTMVGKTVYAFRLDVHTPGYLTIHYCKGTSLSDLQIIRNWTIYVRAVGLQTIRLPEDITLGENEFLAFGGYNKASTTSNVVVNTCRFCYTDKVADWVKMPINSSCSVYSIIFDSSDPSKIIDYTNIGSDNLYLNICLIVRGSASSKLEDLYLSVTGDSITSYANFITKKADVPAGNSAGDNYYYYPRTDVNNIDATWWGILAKDCRMKILRNDAWSGSTISGSNTTCLGSSERYKLLNNLSYNTDQSLTCTLPYGNPNIIISMIGTNDLARNVALGTPDYSNYDFNKTNILEAFTTYCGRLMVTYNSATIVHFIIPRGSSATYINSNNVSIGELAQEMEKIANNLNQYFIPIEYFSRLNPASHSRYVYCKNEAWSRGTQNLQYTSTDTLHPNAIGMEIIADGVKRYLESIM